MEITQAIPWYRDPATLSGLSSIVIALATLLYVIISVFLWKATKRSADITEKMFEASNRPYIGIDRIDAVDKDYPKKIDLTVKNFGTVPAKDVWEETTARTHNEVVHHHKSDPTILCQGGAFVSGINISEELYSAILLDSLPLVITIDIHYKALGDIEYQATYTYEYAKERGCFRLKGGSESQLSTLARTARSLPR